MLTITIASIASLFITVLSDQIYPVQNSKEIQLENGGWVDCSTKAEILPINCQGDDLMWQECYVVPQNGLCSKQNISTGSSDTLNFGFTFYQASASKIDIEINGQSFSEPLNQQTDQTRAIIKASASSASIKIKNTGLQFTGLTISKDCLPNCQTCSSGFCETCYQDAFYYYNYRCSKNSCEDQIGQLSMQSLLDASGQIVGDNYQVDLSFDFDMGDCLIPKAYFTYALENSKVKLILPESQVAYNGLSGLKLTIPIKQVIDKCEMVNGTDAYIYSCYIGVAVTNELVSQYMAVLIGQISVDKGTSATTQFTQSVSIPSDMTNSVGPVFIISETLSIKTNSDSKLITVLQTIADPAYSNYKITYYQAYITQNNRTIKLSLNTELQHSINTTFIFAWTDTQFDPSATFDLVVNSIAAPSTRRRLDASQSTRMNREQLIVEYQAKNHYTFTSSESIAVPSIDDGPLVGIIVGSFAGVVLLIIGVSKVLNSLNK